MPKIKILHNITDKETGEAMPAGVIRDVNWDKDRIVAAGERGLIAVVPAPRLRGRKPREKGNAPDDISTISDQAG